MNLFREIATQVRIYVYMPAINMAVHRLHRGRKLLESGVPDLFVFVNDDGK